MRKIIEEHLPWICSRGDGYFLAKDTKEAQEVVEYLTSYIRGLAKKRAAILAEYPDAGQLELEI